MDRARTTSRVKGLNDLVSKASFVPAGLLALSLWIVASLPGDDLQRVQSAPTSPLLAFVLSDPFMHFLVFGCLALLIAWGFHAQSRNPIPFVKVALLVSGYGLLIEVYQGLLPWRSFGLDDLAWNTVGVLSFLGLTRWQLGQRIPQRQDTDGRSKRERRQRD